MGHLLALTIAGGLVALAAGGCTSAVAVANGLPYAVSVTGRAHTPSAAVGTPLSSDLPTDAETVELGDVVVEAGGSGSLPKPAVLGPFRKGTISLTFTPVAVEGGTPPRWRSCSAWLSSAPSQVVLTIRAFEPGSDVLIVEAREGFGPVIENLGVRWELRNPEPKAATR